MIHETTKLIQKEFNERGVFWTKVQETADYSAVVCRYEGSYQAIIIYLVSPAEGSYVKITSEVICKYPKERIAEGYELMNILNSLFRYEKWVMDEEGGIYLDYDIPYGLAPKSFASIVYECFLQICQVAEAAQKIIMRAIWKGFNRSEVRSYIVDLETNETE